MDSVVHFVLLARWDIVSCHDYTHWVQFKYLEDLRLRQKMGVVNKDVVEAGLNRVRDFFKRAEDNSRLI